jgi:transcriptional regulator PpsR
MSTNLAIDRLGEFRSPAALLGDVDASGAARLLSAAGDIALIIDRDGMIRDAAFASEDLSRDYAGKWIDQRWIDTVTVESKEKIESLLKEAAAGRSSRWRQVNHPHVSGTDVPVTYSAVNVGDAGSIVAVGRDLRSMATLQSKLVETQQSMEREYARLRHAETRYRLLFQISSEAVLVIDGATRKIIEANPAATALLGLGTKNAVGKTFVDLFDGDSAPMAEQILGAARSTGRAEDGGLTLRNATRDVAVTASLFRQDRSVYYLIRLSHSELGLAAAATAEAQQHLGEVVERLPDALIVTDLDQRILTANAAFLEMTQLATIGQAEGEPLDRWLGRSGVDCNVLVASMREHGAVQHFGTILRGEYGHSEDVEVSGVFVPGGEQPCLGFMIRSLGRRLPVAFGQTKGLPDSVTQLTELVGRMSMKELVRETTDVIEKLCIEAALELTNDNRASAAEMLGLSRQSLYAKLRRYGLGDLGNDDEK